MNDESNAQGESSPFTSGQRPERAGSTSRRREEAIRNGYATASAPRAPQPFGAADLLPFLDALGRRWFWLLFSAALLAGIGFYCGRLLWSDSYTASSQLIRQASAHVNDTLGERELEPNSYISLLRTPELLKRVAGQAKSPISADALAGMVNITPERNSDVILIAISAADQETAVDLANLYAREAVKFTQELQTNSAARVSAFLAQQIAPLEEEIIVLNKMPQQVPKAPLPAASRSEAPAPSPLIEKLQAARLELVDLLAHYTERHPLVREQQAKVDALETQVRQLPAAPVAPVKASADPADELIAQELDPAFIRTKLQSLQNARLTLIEKEQAALALARNPPGSCKLLAPATLKDAIAHKRTPKVAIMTGFAGLVGLLIAGGLILLGEVVDPRLKTAADVQRVTGLSVVASAGDLARMNKTEQMNWAFRAWTSLQHLLSPSPNQGFVCGITSSENGEGRSTWIRLLADAASQRGFRVLTIVARPPERNGKMIADTKAAVEKKQDSSAAQEAQASGTTQDTKPLVPANGHALVANNVLTTPDEVTQKLIGPNPEPVVEIPLPGWVWNLERRKQWQTALRDWSQIDNIALLVELPPASMPETVLLAENLPNLIWLADVKKATAAETRDQLETLRHARCHLAGAVINRARVSLFGNRFARWLSSTAVLILLHGLPMYGQESPVRVTNQTALAANTNLSFSVVGPTQRAAWQQKLTLGPGDVVTLALWREPALTRADVAIGPDGRISFAEAQDVLATGLTLDELRARMNEELAKFRRAPEIMITPVAFRSKKYYMLGHVTTKGVYILDRPITVLEAVARARGFESGLVDRNIISVADFSRSFLIRKGKRIPLNFEGLFQNGDLSQNMSIEPDDFIYFPGANVKEVYILGEVRLPGPASYTPNLTLMAAITARAGYTDRAYKGKVLVVRGSLNKPEVFAVETKDILAGKAPDFRLQPKDIIFVNSRPFIYVEELADTAIVAFLQSIVTATVGVHLIQQTQGE